MRLKMIIDTKRTLIPYEYHGFLQAALYRAFEEDTGEFLHNEGFKYERRSYKMFVFSELAGKYEPNKNGLVFTSNVSFYISSVYPEILQELWDYFSNRMTITIGKNTFEIIGLIPENDLYEENDSNVYTLKTLSPITAYKTDEKGFTNYFNPKSQDFENSLLMNLERKYKTLFGQAPDQEYFRIVEIKKQKSSVVKYKRTVYQAYHLIFKVEISPAYLMIATHAGLGAKNSAGFGMTVVKQ